MKHVSKRWRKRLKKLLKSEQVYVEIALGLSLNIIYGPILSSIFRLSDGVSILGGFFLSFLTMMPFYIKEVFFVGESRFDEKKEKQNTNQEKEKNDDIMHAKESLSLLTRRMQFVIKDEETFEETFGEGVMLLQTIREVIQEHQSEKEVMHYIQYDVIQKVDDILSTYEQMSDESKQQANRDLKQLFQRKRIELHDCYLKQKEERLQQTFEKQIQEFQETKQEYVYVED